MGRQPHTHGLSRGGGEPPACTPPHPPRHREAKLSQSWWRSGVGDGGQCGLREGDKKTRGDDQTNKTHPHPPSSPDLDAFYRACDPASENLCLYGDADPSSSSGGRWAVAPPADEVPPELPEPCLGINFAR